MSRKGGKVGENEGMRIRGSGGRKRERGDLVCKKKKEMEIMK